MEGQLSAASGSFGLRSLPQKVHNPKKYTIPRHRNGDENVKNLKGALPPKRDDLGSSGGNFLNLGIVLMVSGFVLCLGSIVVFFTSDSGEYVNGEGRAPASPRVFVFMLVMSVVLLVVGLALMQISKSMGKKPVKRAAGTKMTKTKKTPVAPRQDE